MITINPNEKTAIHHYLAHIDEYVDDSSFALLAPYLNNWPNGTKITRAEDTAYRELIIPIGEDGESLLIPFIKHEPNDVPPNEQHACLVIDGKNYYQQNKYDDALQDESDSSDEDDEDDSSELAAQWRAFNARLRANKHQSNYIKNEDKIIFKQVVKQAVDDDGNLFYLKSVASFHSAVIEYVRSTFASESTHVFFRTVTYQQGSNDVTRKKIVQLTPDNGISLWQYMKSASLDPAILAHHILEQYLIQISDRGIVHTDISLLNCCIQQNGDDFKLTWIDWDEAFDAANPKLTGKGTPGQMAPEFFKTTNDFKRQLHTYAESEERFHASLKDDYKHYFTQASDVFALGRVLLEIGLPKESPYYKWAMQCCTNQVAKRPNGEAIRNFLDEISPRIGIGAPK